MLASEYGWSKRDILEDTYPDELMKFSKAIGKRRKGHYLMLMNIAGSPYSDEEGRQNLIDYLSDRDRANEHLDKAGMLMLMQKMADNNTKVKFAPEHGINSSK